MTAADAFDVAMAAILAWFGELPLDGSSTPRTEELEAQIVGALEALDRGDVVDQRRAGDLWTLVQRVNQRRASKRGEN